MPPLVADDLDDGGTFLQLPLLVDAFNPLDWRTEVKENGQYWQWRKGSGSNRTSRYGGTFDQLSTERKAAYEANKRKRTTTQTRDANRGVGDAAISPSLPATERSASALPHEQGGLTASA
ncbi:hypothetical protein [Herpetosiphon geysericola]|uniref:hypothetical protein n=1 Tax=Herpetosiphon geysericola TaxID=70996 RepID=UPI00128EA91B|nr:hypothetical protein [Herpetosiphon geysericola]